MRDVRGYLASRKQNAKYIFLENENSLITPLAVCASLLKERQPKGPDEERNSQWWEMDTANGQRNSSRKGFALLAKRLNLSWKQ